jgi:hypothetical protein
MLIALCLLAGAGCPPVVPLPDTPDFNDPYPILTTKQLEAMATRYGVKRQTGESNDQLRRRLADVITGNMASR